VGKLGDLNSGKLGVRFSTICSNPQEVFWGVEEA
jgi:hypothetical protein